VHLDAISVPEHIVVRVQTNQWFDGIASLDVAAGEITEDWIVGIPMPFQAGGSVWTRTKLSRHRGDLNGRYWLCCQPDHDKNSDAHG
jgi:hypothetical protein